jgi:membrane protease YdiL (CAAX protease family)
MATSLPVTESAEPLEPRTRAIAPAWHTILIIVLMLTVSFAGANRDRHALSHEQRVSMYVITMAAEWIMLAFVVWGVHRRKSITLRELIGGKWKKPEDALLDVAIGIGFLFVSMLVLGGLGYLLGLHKQQADAQKLAFLAPRGTLELLLWIGVSCTAGICEEIIYRGYFQRQFAAWTNMAWFGLVVQGMLFGFSHGYEGAKRMILIAIFGMMFGVVALWRKSLRPGIITHAGYDIFAGIALRFIPK